MSSLGGKNCSFFKTCGTKHICAFSVLSQRSESVPHNRYCLWKSPHDQTPNLLPLLAATEQDFCTLLFLNSILLFCFPSLSYSPLSLPLWGGLGLDLSPHWKAAHTLQPLSFIFGWVKADVGWTQWQHASIQSPEPNAGRSSFAFALCPGALWTGRSRLGMAPALCSGGMCEQHPDHTPGPSPYPAPFSSHHGMRGEQKNRTNTWQCYHSTLS